MTDENIPFLPAQEQTEDRPAPLIDYVREMHDALTMAPETGPPLLRQITLMDKLASGLFEKALNDPTDFGIYHHYHRIDFALRLQKQCMDTLKAHAAINYMNALLPVTLPPVPYYPSPTPRKNDEQNE